MNKMRNNYSSRRQISNLDEEFIEKLRKKRPIPSPSLQDRVLNTVLEKEKCNRKRSFWQNSFKNNRLIFAFCLLLIIFIIFPTRIWAADEFSQLLVYFNIKHKANEEQPHLFSEGDAVQYLDLDTIRSQAGFLVSRPDYLPDRYSELGFYKVGDVVYWKATLMSIDTESNEVDMLVLQQTLSTRGTLNIGSATVEMLTVHQQPALWIQGVMNYSFSTLQENTEEKIQPKVEPSPSSFLVWEENSITYTLQSRRLPLSDMLSIAESIHE